MEAVPVVLITAGLVGGLVFFVVDGDIVVDPKSWPGRYENPSSVALVVGSATSSDVDVARVFVGRAGGFLLDVNTDVSAGGGPILELELGMTELLDGSTVRVGALLSVVRVPPAPYSPG
jgi:hypothetical protein